GAVDPRDPRPARPRRRGGGRRRGRPARRVAGAQIDRGRAGRGPARDPGRVNPVAVTAQDTFEIGGRELTSRLLLGTGGFRSLDTMAAAIEASGTQLVTVALRRIDPSA